MSSTDSDLVSFREMEADDLMFVISSWNRSYERHARAHNPAAWWGTVRFRDYNQRLRDAPDSVRSKDEAAVQHYYSTQDRIIKALLARCGARVAFHPDTPDLIVGWICGEPEAPWDASKAVLHFVYVRKRFRSKEFGIGRRLVRHVFGENPKSIVCSHWLFDSERHKISKRHPVFSYDPSLVVNYGIGLRGVAEADPRTWRAEEILQRYSAHKNRQAVPGAA